MRQTGTDEGQVRIDASEEELRLLLGVLNESLHGPYKIPEDEWVDLMHRPIERGEALLDDLLAIVKRLDGSPER